MNAHLHPLDQPAPAADLDELAKALQLSAELTGEAFRACALARRLVGEGCLTLPADTVALLEQERYYGRALDAHEGARALRKALHAC